MAATQSKKPGRLDKKFSSAIGETFKKAPEIKEETQVTSPFKNNIENTVMPNLIEEKGHVKTEETTTLDKTTQIKEENIQVKNKGGRPSVGEVKKISLAVPIELVEGMETGAALFYKGNTTAYINSLIKKDLDENLEKYQEFKKMSLR